MTVTAARIAAALRHSRPDITPAKVHKLLYFAQGHHLAWFAEPLFTDPVVAWDNGPIIQTLLHRPLPEPSIADLPEKALNTVGYVCSRYRNLSRIDLETLTKAQQPWTQASQQRRPGIAVPISLDVMRAYFATVDIDDEQPIITAAQLAAHLDGAEERRRRPAKPDDMARLRAMAVEIEARATARSA